MSSPTPRRVVWALLLAPLALAGDALQQSAGKYQVTLRLPSGGLYAQEEMQIEFRVADTSRPDPLSGFAPVVRLAPEAGIDMPEMPGMPRFTETAHAEGTPGDYGIHPTFAHGGEFRLRLAFQPPEGERVAVEFALHVLDPDKAAHPKPLAPRFRMEVSAEPRKPRAGEPVQLRLEVRDRDNANAVVTAFEPVHEALMHLVVVRRDLSHFAHEHPVVDANGTFRLSYTFASGGDYRLFADVAPQGAGAQILAAKLTVSGSEAAGFDIRKAWSQGAPRVREAGECRVELVSPQDSLPVRKTVPVIVEIKDARTGLPVSDLEPYVGAPGHLMLVHEDGSTFVHSHPDGSAGAAGGTLRFLARFPEPGLYRGWVQFQRGGRVITADFLMRAGADR
ncbi:MAG: hypothetical protein LAP87_05560 [Acidobacteriia bacterium]|nr:hypothetical protein [Terriglobia bacterium]